MLTGAFGIAVLFYRITRVAAPIALVAACTTIVVTAWIEETVSPGGRGLTRVVPVLTAAPPLRQVMFIAQVIGSLCLTVIFVAAALPVHRQTAVSLSFAKARWHSHGRAALFGLAIGGYGIFAMTVLRGEPTAIREISSIPIALLGVGFWVLLLTTVFVLIPRRFGLPSLIWVPLLLFVWFASSNENHQVRGFVAQIAGDRIAPGDKLSLYIGQWLATRPLREGERYPVFVVAAEGGGARAAYWAASALARLEDLTGGRFHKHVIGISGVSGGSLGAALYATLLADRRDGAAYLKGRSFLETTRAVLKQDHLSEVVTSLLFGDALQRLFPRPVFPDRAAALEKSWEHSWSVVTGNDRMAQPFLRLWTEDLSKKRENPPALFLNATQVESGKRFIISNIALDHTLFQDAYFAFDPRNTFDASKASVSTMAHLSARFSYVSPAGLIMGYPSSDAEALRRPEDRSEVTWGSVVDGGYFDNSGAITAWELLRALRYYEPQWRHYPGLPSNVQLDVYAVLISNDPDSAEIVPLWREDNPFATLPSYVDAPRDGLANLKVRPWEPSARTLRDRSTLNTILERTDANPDLFARSKKLADAFAPIETFLTTRPARASLAKSVLVDAVNDPPDGFFSSPCCEPRSRALHTALEFDPCRIFPRAAEINLARALASDMDADRWAGEMDPPLGWFLSTRTAEALDRAVESPFAGLDSVASIVSEYAAGHTRPRTHCELLSGSSRSPGVDAWRLVNSGAPALR
jgi:hypothetical protein